VWTFSHLPPTRESPSIQNARVRGKGGFLLLVYL